MKGPNQYSRFNHIPHICYACNGIWTSKNTRGAPNWFLNLDEGGRIIGMLCNNCYSLFITYPKLKARGWFNTKYTYGNNKWHIIIYTGWNWKQRTGYCSLCPNNIHDGSCKRTNLHHKYYLRIFPWFGRIEVCRSCHSKLEWEKDTFANRPNRHAIRRAKLALRDGIEEQKPPRWHTTGKPRGAPRRFGSVYPIHKSSKKG